MRFASALIKFRRQQPTVRREHFLTGKPKFDGDLPDVSWFSALGTAVDWHGDDATLIALLKAVEPEHDPEGKARDVLILVNATHRSRASSSCRRSPKERAGGCSSTRPPRRRTTSIPTSTARRRPARRRLTLSYRSMCVLRGRVTCGGVTGGGVDSRLARFAKRQ